MDDSDAGKMIAGIVTVLLVLAVGAFVGCESCTLIEPGHVGITIERAGANRGVQDMPIVSGWVSFNPITETVIEFPVVTQTAIWTRSSTEGSQNDDSITFSSREGVTVSSDVALSYHVDPAHAGRLYTRFRTSDLSSLTHGYVRNLVRDGLNEVASQMTIQDIYGVGKTRLLQESLRTVRERMGNDGFVIDQLSFQGALRLPENVVQAINRAMQATQDAVAAQNRVQQIEAEARQRAAQAEGEANAARVAAQGAADALRTRAQSDADALGIRTTADAHNREVMAVAQAHANALISGSLTPALIEYRRNERWNGTLPTYQGSGTPMIQMH